MATTTLATVHLSERSTPLSTSIKPNEADPRWLVASPYLDLPHLLDLNTLDLQSRLFAVALSHLNLATDDYATVRYEDIFDFSSLMSKLKSLTREQGFGWLKQDFYVVEFRSKVKEEYDTERLSFLDSESHKEAVASGGLLKYWFGTPNSDRRNLATCFWRNKIDAINGGKGPLHREARGFIGKAYESIHIKGLRLTIEDDVSSWSIAPYES